MFSAPIFVLLTSFVLQYVSAEKKAFILMKVPVIECTDIPNDGVCPRDHKIPDFAKVASEGGKPIGPIYNATSLNQTISSILNTLFNGQNNTCKESYRAFFCSQSLPDCEDPGEFITMFGEKTLKLCEKAKKDCSGLSPLILNSMLNCNLTARKFPKRNLTCKAYPDIKNDPYPCPKRIGLKGPFASKERGEAVLSMHNVLKKAAGKLNKKCVDDVSQMMCDAAPACSRDEKYIVNIVNKQQCQTVMGCLNVTKDANLTKGAFGICDRLADKTAKTISLSDVYTTGDATTQGASSVIMFFSLFYFTQYLYYF